MLGGFVCGVAIVVCTIILILGYLSGAKGDTWFLWKGIGLGVAGLIVLFLLNKLDCVIESTPN
jgi:multisubunit Na+/H+ antiporter MnhB subunit